MSKSHSLYSLSASARLACSESFRMSADLPREESVYAAEGTKAHDLCEHALRTGENLGEDDEMRHCVQTYLDEVNRWREHYWLIEEHIERRLESLEVPGAGGTADCVLVGSDDDGLCMHILDYKHGVGVPVDVVGNKQLLSYAWVATEHLGREVDVYRGTIIQPRCPQKDDVCQTWEFDVFDVFKHRDWVKERIADTRLHIGDHCTWCPALSICPAQRQRALELAQRSFSSIITPGELVELKKQKRAIIAFLDRIDSMLLEQMQAGQKFDEFKAVVDVSARKWTVSEDKVLATLKAKRVPQKAVVQKKLRTPTQLIADGYGDCIKGLYAREDKGFKVVPASSRGEAVDFTAHAISLFEGATKNGEEV